MDCFECDKGRREIEVLEPRRPRTMYIHPVTGEPRR